MAQEYEALLKALLKNPKGGKAAADIEKYAALLNTMNGKKLLSSLAGDGGDALKKAAGAAAEGDTDAAKKLLSSLLSSKEGASLAAQVIELSKQGK